MRLRRHRSPLLLLLLPSLTTSLVIDARAKPGSVEHLAQDGTGSSGPHSSVPHTYVDADSPSVASISKSDVGTKDAPVDGLDGKPHAGPFVESTKKKPVQQVEDIGTVTPGRGKESREKALKDDWELPEDDGIMSDIGDRAALKGPTGTEGGVSQKDREKKGKGQLENKPEQPKEAPPSHSWDGEKKSASKTKEGEGEVEKKKGAAGLEVSRAVIKEQDFALIFVETCRPSRKTT